MRFITGIKPTGTPHLGNYLSMMKPIFDMANDDDKTIYCFIADGHALTTQPLPQDMENSIIEVSKTLLSLGIHNYNNVVLYRQSQIPEIFELFWIISCFTAKGLLNRNHTYVVETQENINKGRSRDHRVNTGLFNYPVLMASDILSVNAEKVMVGRDQKQHIDITRDIAERINSFYQREIFSIPEEYYARDGVESIPGLDGRKMSKSYDNIIPLFCSEKELKKLIFSIPTNSKNVGERKFRNESDVCYLIEQFGNDGNINDMNTLLEEGNSWGDVKKLTFEVINRSIEKYRENYNYYNTIPTNEMFSHFEEQESEVRSIVRSKLKEIKDISGLIC